MDSVLTPHRPHLRAAGPAVRVFDRDPELIEELDPATQEVLRRRVLAPGLTFARGPAVFPDDPAFGRTSLGLLVIEGLLSRSLLVDGRWTPELLGPGDLLRPWQDDAAPSLQPCAEWEVLQPAVIAVFDEQVTAVTCRFPTVVCRLGDRLVRRSRALAFERAVAHVRSAEQRMLLLLWELADRWGRVTQDGVLVELGVRQEVLAHLVCLRRPTASSALQALARSGRITSLPGGSYLLHAPADLEAPAA